MVSSVYFSDKIMFCLMSLVITVALWLVVSLQAFLCINSARLAVIDKPLMPLDIAMVLL